MADHFTDTQFLACLNIYEIVLEQFLSMDNAEAARQVAIRKASEAMSVPEDSFKARLNVYEEEKRAKVLTFKPGGLLSGSRSAIPWYSGAKTNRGIWPAYKKRIESKLPTAAVADIHDSTEAILGRCANPRLPHEKRKGLVVGYVQSGKTANFQALIAKAVDAGYRIIIVLAGMHSNLRSQTQTRLNKDLQLRVIDQNRPISWTLLTNENQDISDHAEATILSGSENAVIMVVKKHETRLANIRSFLEKVNDAGILGRRPVLIIDDESDQATPNSENGKKKVSTINSRIRDIWSIVQTGTYVAYTATPFANILIDPQNTNDFYPEDFVISLPKPDGYMGADEFFNTRYFDDESEELFDSLCSLVPFDESSRLIPAGQDISNYAPEITDSLKEAIYWFVIVTAIREIRSEIRDHSSMLIHTSHRTAAHSALKDVIDYFVQELAFEYTHLEQEFHRVFDRHIHRATSLRGDEIIPAWKDIWERVNAVIGRITVKEDNGSSRDRLSYPDGDPQVVIAIGGGTLSRGLTLEGLAVSFFLRTSNTYDTLLQMGRWFGFRPGYADLVRVWVGHDLIEDYRHLASVEREIRDDIFLMEKAGKTPRQLALKVLTHPGRLEVTSRGKMSNATIVQAGLSLSRKQTIYLNKEADALRKSLNLVRRFAERAISNLSGKKVTGQNGDILIPEVRSTLLVDFLNEFWTSDPWINGPALQNWLDRHGSGKSWDVVLVSGRGGPRTSEFEYSEGIKVNKVSRAPISDTSWNKSRLKFDFPANAELVNIRALMSSHEYSLDLQLRAESDDFSGLTLEDLSTLDRDDVASVKEHRQMLAPDRGLVLLYIIDRDSQPQRRTTNSDRVPMNAEEDLVGISLVYPFAADEDEREFTAVRLPELDFIDSEEMQDEPWPEDNEGDYQEIDQA